MDKGLKDPPAGSKANVLGRNGSPVRVIENGRERVLRHGAAALGDSELLALVLGTGTRGRPARAIAESLLALGPGLRELSRRETGELHGVAGVGSARSAQVAAAFE